MDNLKVKVYNYNVTFCTAVSHPLLSATAVVGARAAPTIGTGWVTYSCKEKV